MKPSHISCLIGLLLASSWAMAQGQISDGDRAKRDADKVFNFIKFHAVRGKAAPAPATQLAAAPAAAVAAPAKPRSEAVAEPEAAPAPPVTRSLSAPAGTAQVQSQAEARPGLTLPPASEPLSSSVVASTSAQPEPEPEEVNLKLINHVQPELPRGNNLRNGSVRVRFTVLPDGSVTKVSANESAQRRLASSAIRAIEQWRFAAIAQAQEVEVDLDFRFD